MNIFYLDTNLEKCTSYHVDTHVVKMPIETTQMLCTVLRERFGVESQYRSVYINHPCTRWVGQTRDNFRWTLAFGMALCKEYTHRYGKTHATEAVLHAIADIEPDATAWNRVSPMSGLNGLTNRPACVRAEFKLFDTVTAYRMQYIFTKNRLHKWTNRPVPAWIQDQSWTKEV